MAIQMITKLGGWDWHIHTTIYIKWKKSKKKKPHNEYMYMYNWFTLLYSWNEHNILNQQYSSKSFWIIKIKTKANDY